MNRLLNALLLLSTICVAVPAHDGPLRLYLADATQEALTTPLNWPDLPATKPKPLPVGPKPFRILLDAGHGGKDLGAIGHFSIQEKDYALRMADLVRRELEREKNRRGFALEVKLSREIDSFLGLRERANLANEWGADVFVSLHLNSSPVAKARGFEVYFLSAEASDAEAARLAHAENSEKQTSRVPSTVLSILSDAQTSQHVTASSFFAETMFQAISKKVRSNGRGVRQGPFTVLAGTSMPSVLIELGYLSNPEEAQQLTSFSYLKRLAGAISTGIIEFALQKKRLS